MFRQTKLCVLVAFLGVLSTIQAITVPGGSSFPSFLSRDYMVGNNGSPRVGGMAMSATGHFFASDTSAGKVQRWAPNTIVRTMSRTTSTPQLTFGTGVNNLAGLCVDEFDTLWVVGRDTGESAHWNLYALKSASTVNSFSAWSYVITKIAYSGSTLTSPTVVDVSCGSANSLWVGIQGSSGFGRIFRVVLDSTYTNVNGGTNTITARGVIGATSGVVQGTTISSTYVGSVTYDNSTGALWVGSVTIGRVLRFSNAIAMSNGTNDLVKNPDLVLGKADFNANSGGTTSTNVQDRITSVRQFTDGSVIAADKTNNRALIWLPPLTNGKAASIFLGQTTSTASTSSSGHPSDPLDIFISEADGTVLVAADQVYWWRFNETVASPSTSASASTSSSGSASASRSSSTSNSASRSATTSASPSVSASGSSSPSASPFISPSPSITMEPSIPLGESRSSSQSASRSASMSAAMSPSSSTSPSFSRSSEPSASTSTSPTPTMAPSQPPSSPLPVYTNNLDLSITGFDDRDELGQCFVLFQPTAITGAFSILSWVDTSASPLPGSPKLPKIVYYDMRISATDNTSVGGCGNPGASLAEGTVFLNTAVSPNNGTYLVTWTTPITLDAGKYWIVWNRGDNSPGLSKVAWTTADTGAGYAGKSAVKSTVGGAHWDTNTTPSPYNYIFAF